MRTPRLAITLVALGFLAGCSKEAETPRAAAPPVVVSGVRVEAVAAQAVAESVDAVGTVRSRRQTVVSSKIVATVLGVHAREGQRVHAGDLLVTLDDRDVQAQTRRAEAAVREARGALEETDRSLRAAERAVEAARAQRDLAASTLERYRLLLDRRSVAPQEFDEVQARHRAAQAELDRAEETGGAVRARQGQVQARIEQAEAELAGTRVGAAYARITAPADGIVVARTVEVGNLAAPGAPLLAIEEEHYRLEAAVEEAAMRSLRPGQRAAVVIDALGGGRTGTVGEIVPAADPASRTVTVKIDLAAEPGLRSGLYGRASFPAGERQALLVPRGAVVERGQLESVFVVGADGVARQRLVKTGRAVAPRVEILSGLAAGERVVVDGVERVIDGARVEPRG